MFKLEKEMIPVLRRHLSEKYQTNYFIDEFNSGNGIADLVFTTEIENKENLIFDYELIFVVLKYLNRKNKKIEIKKFYKEVFLTKKQVFKLVDLLLDIGVLGQVKEGVFIVKDKYSPPIKKITSIEAKLFDWKNGFYQALRYKTYSHKSYLAISREFSHRVNLDLLRENNVGLITVSPEKVDIVLKVKTEKPSNLVAYTYLAEKFYNGLCSVDI